MKRRDLVKQALGAGSALVLGGVLAPSSALAAKTPVVGYQVGQAFPAIKALDQYNRATTTAGVRGFWTLIDLCPWWCSPCMQSALLQPAFVAEMNARGIPFRLLSINLEELDHTASTRASAERWATRFGIANGVVLHCDGIATSPLRQIVVNLWAANGKPNGTPGYPSYALLDPMGVIRYYQVSSELNPIQAALQAFTGVTLPRIWDLPRVPNPDLSPPFSVLPVEILGYQSNGVAIAGTISDPNLPELVYPGGITGLRENFLTIGYTTGDPGFNLDTPLRVASQVGAAPVASLGLYLLILEEKSTLFSENDLTVGIDVFPKTTVQSNGTVVMNFSAFRPIVPVSTPDLIWPYLRLGILFRATAPYSASATIFSNVSASTKLGSTTKSQVLALLDAVCSRLAQRDLVGAADKASKAAIALQLDAGDYYQTVNAKSLSAYLAALSTGTLPSTQLALRASTAAASATRRQRTEALRLAR